MSLPHPTFSLVVATVGRTDELDRLFRSILDQTEVTLEVILVDQNPDDRLGPIIARYMGSLAVTHLRSEPGLSRARNVGLEHATGEIVAFPDDDCWYPAGVLARVAQRFRLDPGLGGVSGQCRNADGIPICARWDRCAGEIDRFNVWTRAISITIFIRRGLAFEVGGFDLELGAGAPTKWGSGEESDFLIRALEHGRISYEPTITVHHPDPIAARDGRWLTRAKSYGRGLGRVLRKHHYPLWFVAVHLVRPLGGAMRALMHRDSMGARYYWYILESRLLGWLDAL